MRSITGYVESKRSPRVLLKISASTLGITMGYVCLRNAADFNALRRKLKTRYSIRMWYSVAAILVLMLSVGGVFCGIVLINQNN